VTTKLTEMTERELASWYWSRDMDTHAETLAALRDGVVAEVRAECAATLRDMESASHAYRRSSEEWQRRAERAERERDECKKAIADARGQRDDAIAALAEARREGERKIVERVAFETLSASTLGAVRERIERLVAEYAPPVPASVTLGEWTVTYEPHTVTANWRADGKEQGYKATRFEHTIPALLHAIRYTPTVDEYAALRALEARQ